MFQNGSLHACSLIPSHDYNNMFTHLNTCTCSFFAGHQNLCLDCKMLVRLFKPEFGQQCLCIGFPLRLANVAWSPMVSYLYQLYESQTLLDNMS